MISIKNSSKNSSTNRKEAHLGQQTLLKVKLGDRLENDFLDEKLPMPHPLTSIKFKHLDSHIFRCHIIVFINRVTGI